MIESPLIQSIVDESQKAGRVKSIVEFLEVRFTSASPTISAGLRQVKDQAGLSRLMRFAVTCANLAAFEAALHEELPQPPPASTRASRRKKE